MIFLWYHHYMRNNEETKQNQMISIAGDVLRAAKDRIVANMRFMDSAIFALREKCDANRACSVRTVRHCTIPRIT